MDTTILLVATATQWFGTARMPRDLAQAGWTVALLAPRGTLAEHSRYVQKIGHLPENATPLQWVHALATMVKAIEPRLLLPCDDTAFRLMSQLVLAPPDNLQPSLHLQLASLIVESIGDPTYYRASIDKTLLCRAAEKLGVLVPRYEVVSDMAGATAFAASHTWPVVLKREHSAAGEGVAVCEDKRSLALEFVRLLDDKSVTFSDATGRQLLVQEYIPGRTQYYAGTTWRGSLLCGYAVEKLDGDRYGPASVVRYYHSPEMEQSATTLAAGFGVTGIIAPEYIIDERSGRLYLIEINRRMTPGTHRGAIFNMSSAKALMAALGNVPPSGRVRLDPGEEHIYVSFPHEWLRDPASPYLRKYPVDAPWDDPHLLAAMIATRPKR